MAQVGNEGSGGCNSVEFAPLIGELCRAVGTNRGGHRYLSSILNPLVEFN